jgi:carnitine 3-dehydrogenase
MNAGSECGLPRSVACVGLGLIGASWAAIFLARGLHVIATDTVATAWERALPAIEKDIADLREIGPVAEDWRSRLRFEPELADAVHDADFVQESGPESLAVKEELLAAIDRSTPPATIIASSTSGIPMTRLQQACRRPERCVVGHPFTPVHLVPLVEVVSGAATSRDTAARAAAFYRNIGKEVVEVRRDIPGFIGNRFQAVVLQEALSLVKSGVATVQEVDQAFVQGPGFRWARYGPFALAAFSAGERGLTEALRKYHIHRDDVLASIEKVVVDDTLIERIEGQVADAETFHDLRTSLSRRNSDFVTLLKLMRPEST